MNNSTPSFAESSADDYFLFTSAYSTFIPVYQHAYTWRPIFYSHPNDWGNNYNPIYYSNLSLELLEKIPITSSNALKWRNAKGSALFYRSLHFMQLVWTYSKAYDESTASIDLGIPLKLESDFNIEVDRSSVAQSYSQILKDANASLEYLPDFPQVTTRPSKQAAFGLLARVYLSMRQYDSAFKYSNLALQLNNQLMNFGTSPVNPSSTNPFPDFKLNPEIIYYHLLTTSLNAYTPPDGLIDSTLSASYSDNDWRKSTFFRDMVVGGKTYKRYQGSYSRSTSACFSGMTTSEMYLIRAECYARLGNKDAALIDLNKVLQARWKTGFVPVTSVTAADALEVVLKERRKELVMRGLRWIDIKRLNKEGRDIKLTRDVGGILFTLQPNANYYALPLPGDIINLTGIKQNPY